MNCKRNILILILVAFFILGDQQAKADFVFGIPESLGSTVNTTRNEGSIDLAPNGLTLYFGSDRPGGRGNWDLWMTTRRTEADPWEPPVNLGAPVNGYYAEGSPSMTSDGLSLYFHSNRPGGSGRNDIYVTTRVTIEDQWGEPMNLGPLLNSSVADVQPNISADGLSLFFSSTREKVGTPYAGTAYIYVATRLTTSDPWDAPVRLGPIVNLGLEYSLSFPNVSKDGLSLYFTCFSQGEHELWVATRSSVSDSWSRSVSLGLAGVSPKFSADESIMYLSSTEYGSYGLVDLFQVSIDPIVDLNDDGIVDATDMCIIVDNWGTDEPLCDIGPTPLGDGIVDVQDLIVLAEHLFEEIPPDEPIE